MRNNSHSTPVATQLQTSSPCSQLDRQLARTRKRAERDANLIDRKADIYAQGSGKLGRKRSGQNKQGFRHDLSLHFVVQPVRQPCSSTTPVQFSSKSAANFNHALKLCTMPKDPSAPQSGPKKPKAFYKKQAFTSGQYEKVKGGGPKGKGRGEGAVDDRDKVYTVFVCQARGSMS